MGHVKIYVEVLTLRSGEALSWFRAPLFLCHTQTALRASVSAGQSLVQSRAERETVPDRMFAIMHIGIEMLGSLVSEMFLVFRNYIKIATNNAVSSPG